MSISRGIFQEENGKYSLIRASIAFYLVTVIGIWAYVSILKGALQPLSAELVWALGALLTAKTGQKFVETKSPPAGV
jgi:uncharacterized membrane protein YfcA